MSLVRRDRIPYRKGAEKQEDGKSALRHDLREVQTVLRAGGDRGCPTIENGAGSWKDVHQGQVFAIPAYLTGTIAQSGDGSKSK
jgi:hypothetical protein